MDTATNSSIANGADPEFESISILELLESDRRPIFVVDLDQVSTNPSVYYCNPALKRRRDLYKTFQQGRVAARLGASWTTHIDFLKWVQIESKQFICMERLSSYEYQHVVWTVCTIRGRWSIVSGNHDSRLEAEAYIAGKTRKEEVIELVRAARSSTAPQPNTKRLDSLPILEKYEDLELSGKVPGNELLCNKQHPSIDEEASLDETLTLKESTPAQTDTQIIETIDGEDAEWKTLDPSRQKTPFLKFICDFDWSATPLGAMTTWGPLLRHTFDWLQADPNPGVIFWGPDFRMIYNEPYVALAGHLHPHLLGSAPALSLGELWKDYEPIYTNCWENKSSFLVDETKLYLNRNGFMEELFFSGAFIPILQRDGSIIGLYETLTDITRHSLLNRRLKILLSLGHHTGTTVDTASYWPALFGGLDHAEFDLPITIAYSLEDVSAIASKSSTSVNDCSAKSFVVRGSHGVSEEWLAEHKEIFTTEDDVGLGALFRRAADSYEPLVLQRSDGTLPRNIFTEPSERGDKDVCERLVIYRIRPTNFETVLGFLVLGLSSRQLYDSHYQTFVQILCRQVDNSLAAVLSLEQEVLRGRNAANQARIDQQKLADQIVISTREAQKSNERFKRFADSAHVGITINEIDGVATYSNDYWHQLTGFGNGKCSKESWMSIIHPQDQSAMQAVWDQVVNEKCRSSITIRLNKLWLPPANSVSEEKGIHTTISTTLIPEVDDDGTIDCVMTTTTDITQQVWSEQVQRQKMEDAIESRRQQENFLDMTSHEMRNPLNAILQSADGISQAMTEFTKLEISQEIIDDIKEATQSIIYCARHQKSIVDDILTLSKLDASLLVVTPIRVQPILVIKNALKVFAPELQAHKIDFNVHVEKSCEEFRMEYVLLDPTRLLQVFINLVTNAVKFTKNAPVRKINVFIGASLIEPEEYDDGLRYAKHKPSTEGEDTKTAGESVFLHVSVQDTGCGMTEEEMASLFMRFSQATPRTHVDYGGSGLGLFISRQLAELQGGQIGVKSKAGEGSTFAFYIRCQPDGPSTGPEQSIYANQVTNVTVKEHVHRSKIVKQHSAPGRVQKTEQAPTSPCIDFKSLHILLVEDNVINQKVTSKQLRKLGATVTIAGHGVEALEFLQTSRYWKGKELDGKDLTVVLMDIEMPVMNGLVATERIRELQATGHIHKHLPIIAVTANARQEQVDGMRQAGMDSVITKPFTMAELGPCIAKVL